MLNNIYHTMFKNRNIELPLFIHIIEPIGIIMSDPVTIVLMV